MSFPIRNGASPSIFQFPVESRGLLGLFWKMPESWQQQRIRQLGKSLNVEIISAIARRPYRQIVAIIAEAPGE